MKTTQEISQLSDIELLEHICSSSDVEIAYNEFVNRYIKDVQGLCKKLCKWRALENTIGLQIAHDAFEKVKRLKSFKKDQIKSKDERKGIIGFFYKVCLNLFNDYYRTQHGKDNGEPLPTYFNAIQETVKVDVQTNQEIKNTTERIFKKLNPKEKAVLLADIEYKRHQKYLPDDVISSLCTKLGVKNAAGIRKLRERAIVKIKKEIDVINGKN